MTALQIRATPLEDEHNMASKYLVILHFEKDDAGNEGKETDAFVLEHIRSLCVCVCGCTHNPKKANFGVLHFMNDGVCVCGCVGVGVCACGTRACTYSMHI